MTLLSLPEHLRTTATVLFESGPSTAEEISKITKKERAVESGYLNQLVRMKHVNKYREGRKVYFCVNHDSKND
jgi:predicted transcriptional regulator